MKVLGFGGFGSVTLQRDSITKQLYALKKLSKGHIVENGMTKHIVTERDILSLCDSDFLVQYFRSFKDDQYVYMLLEAVLGGDLMCFRRHHPEVFTNSRPPGYSVAFYGACIAEALAYLHSKRIVYRDLKPENVLLDAKGYAKLCDLGFARFCLNKCHTMLGTPEYMAPEVIDLPHRHDHMCDWWALGVTMFELFAGKTPWDSGAAFDDDSPDLMAIRMSHDNGTPDKHFPYSCPLAARDLIRKLLSVDPQKRLCSRNGIDEMRQHSWLGSLKFNFSRLQARTLDCPLKPEISLPTETITSAELAELTNAEDIFVPYEEDDSNWDVDF